MWEAIENSLLTVSDNGYLLLGIYNNHQSMGFTDDMRFGSLKFWSYIKFILHKSPKILRTFILWLAITIYKLCCFLIPNYRFSDFRERGMNAFIAIEDWLFGYPYEYATPDEVISFLYERKFRLIKIDKNDGLRTNSFLFQKQ